MKVRFCENRYCPWLYLSGNGYAARNAGKSKCKKTGQVITRMKDCPLPKEMDRVEICNDYQIYLENIYDF